MAGPDPLTYPLFQENPMLTFEIRVKMPHGGEQKFVIQATSRKNAEAQAAAMSGGKVLGGRQIS